MMDELEQLEDVSKEIRLKFKEYQIAHKKWAQWNLWASSQDWYLLWRYMNAVKDSEIKSAKDWGLQVDLDQESGKAYFENRHFILYELDLLRVKQKDLLRFLWRAVDSEGYYLYSRQEIADRFAGHLPAEKRGSLLDKKLRSYDWFETRMVMDGSRMWTKTRNHLRVVK